MYIYIIHEDIIYDMKLSNTESGQYILTDYDHFGNKRNLVNIDVQDGTWNMYANNVVSIIYNNQPVNSIKLDVNSFYSLTVHGTENIILYTMPLYDSSFSIYEVMPNSSFLIGNEAQCDFIYPYAQSQVKINFDGKKFTYQNLNSNVLLYINRRKSDSGVIHDFDTLFIMGLKVVTFSNKILINNPKQLLKITKSQKIKLPEENYIVPNYSTDIRTFTDFYNESDYYFKSPSFKPEIKPLNLVITDPPMETEKDKSSVLITVIPMLLTSFSSVFITLTTIQKYRQGESSLEDLLTGIFFAGGFLLASVLWPFIERKYYNSVVAKENEENRKQYRIYLDSKRKILQKANEEQKMILTTTNLSLLDCKRVIDNKLSDLFSRNIDSPDFLDICLGIGNVPLNCEIDYAKPDYMPKNNDLLDEVDSIIEEGCVIHDVPFVLSLKENNVISFILKNRNMYRDYMYGIFLQLITLHSYKELKLVILTSDEKSEISFLKESNYCWSNDHSIRYYASNLEEAQLLSSQLERELNQRKGQKDYNVYYLIICDSIHKYNNLNIIEDIIDNEEDIGFGLLIYDMKIGNIPNECVNFVDVSEKEGTFFHTNVSSDEITHFTPTFISNTDINMNECLRKINNIPMKQEASEMSTLPETFGFLEMYGVGNVEQLNAPMRWDNSNLSSSLAVPIGIDVNENLVYLDLHEKNHGPHGLIAGMTGSGKSELIVTYILSLAVNFRPDEVQFVLIDYKGGGLAGAFENRKTNVKLPHLIGTITNLDQAEMHRTLVSINSELHRRQKIFNETKDNLGTGNIDIYKYQKLYRSGSVKEPLSHLFIVCDEFAELKAQQPDFMDELVSAARIGRSLGIHLILATQKPSGVVDDQIWSNAKFKICCKVQTSEDSNEMIQRPDAAYLKQAGSFYLQVGYDEYFTSGQSAYSGLTYIPSNRILSKIDNDISFIGNTGDSYKTISDLDVSVKEQKEELGEELTNILKYIIEQAEKRNYTYHQLWLENIPDHIYCNNIIKKYDIKPELFNIAPIIGEYDDPGNQEQGYVKLNITEGGNTFVAGSSGSGKNTLFSTIIYSTIIHHNCDEVNFYIIDLGSEKLKKFKSAPQVGDILTIDDSDKIKYLFYMLETEKNNRQEYYSNNPGDFLSDVKKGKSVFPNIVVMIYDIDVFKETFEDLYDDMFTPFTRNCAKYGIYFIISSNSISSLGYRVENNFPQKVVLNMLDSTDYNTYFDHPPIPSSNPGRGIINIEDTPYEFQTALIFDEITEEENLDYVLDQLNKYLKNHVKPVSMIPLEVNQEMLLPYKTTLSAVPLGINLVTAQVAYYDFSKPITLISTSETKNSIKFTEGLIKQLSIYENTNVVVLNALDEEVEVPDNVKQYDKGFKKIVSVLDKNIKKYNEKTDEEQNEFIIIALGYGKLQNHFDNLREEDEDIIDFEDLILHAKNNQHFKFIIFDAIALFDDIEDTELYDMLDLTTGIWVGKGFDSQSLIDAPSSFRDNVQQNNDSAVLVKQGNAEYIKYVK